MTEENHRLVVCPQTATDVSRDPDAVRFVLCGTSLVCVRVGQDGLIRWANEAFCQTVDRSGSVAGIPFENVLAVADAQRWARTMASGTSGELMLTFISDSSERTCRCHASPHGTDWILIGDPHSETESFIVSELARANSDLADKGRALTRANARLEKANAEIQKLVRADPLTGLANRRRMEEVLLAELKRASRHGVPISLLLIDIDHFKRVNDEHGHLAGDAALKSVAHLLVALTRQTDLVARYGGEEMLILLTDTPMDGAIRFGERCREVISRTVIDAIRRPVTVSIGVSQSVPEDSASTLIQRADEALYEAKAGGRNRVVAGYPCPRCHERETA